MPVEFRAGVLADIDAILPHMRDFYAFERLAFDEQRARRLIAELIGNDSLGRLIVFDDSGTLAGYMVVGFGFSLEFGGRDALVDELYVVPGRRSQGIGAAAIAHAAQICRDLGIRALHLEADHFNQRAHEFYQRIGFRDHARHLMTWWVEQK